MPATNYAERLRRFVPEERAALAAYELNPGHSDLDDEQPVTVPVGSYAVRCQLGDIRQAKREGF